MFSGFDDGGWWLMVLGCWEGFETTGAGRKLAENHHKQWLKAAGRLGRERREKMEFMR